VSRAARGPASRPRGRTTDKMGMRRPRGDQAPRGARSRRAHLARACARDRDARRRRHDLETGAGGVAQRAPPGSAPERARLFVLLGERVASWTETRFVIYFATGHDSRKSLVCSYVGHFESTCNALTRRALFPLPTGQTHPPRVAQPEPDVPAPPLAFGEPARVRHQNTWLALRRPEPRVPSRRLASAQQPGRPRPPPDPQRERAFANLVASRARRARLAFPRRRRALGARERPGRRDRRDDARPDGGEGGAGGARARARRGDGARERARREAGG